MMAYLYGASVQGIQDFIFKTNQLQEIVGASEIVKGLEEYFRTFANFEENDSRILVNAAGNIKAILDTEEDCQNIVKYFSKNIQKRAYGITISQAVVKMEGKFKEQEDAITELERKLKIQRNKPSTPLDLSINIMGLNPSTSKPLVDTKQDKATQQKREAYQVWFKKQRIEEKDFEKSKKLSYISNGKNKLAVIHADGNGLGELVPKLGDKLSRFSVALNKATIQAFDDAKTEAMKIRDVILGGDDMTVICDANEALGFTQRYLENFEKNTSKIEELKELTDKLTACAGIAYTNEKYPFHYAESLAQALCGQAKNHSNRKASCLMFHNIQSSNFQNWNQFVKDELTIHNDKQTLRCDFGPYYLHEKHQPSIENFINTLEAYRCDGSPISRLRAWMSELHKSEKYASSMLKRINEMAEQSNEWRSCIMEKNLQRFDTNLSNEQLIIEKDGVDKTPIYDILQILSVTEAKR